MTRIRELPNDDGARVLASDRNGGIWIAGTSDRVAHLVDGDLTTATLPHAREVFRVSDLFVDADNVVFAASNQGVRVLAGKGWQSIGVENGVPCEPVSAVLTDSEQSLWMATACGYVRSLKDEWTKALTSPRSKIALSVFGTSAGWISGTLDGFPKSTQTPDGRLWFHGSGDLQMIDPRALHETKPPPRARVEQVFIDRAAFGANDLSHIPPKPREIQIDYTALTFVDPKAVQFRYRLVGHDDTWLEPGTRRQAFYSDLAPGRYTFQVTASNNNGAWNDTAASLAFTVLPAWYQTWAFRAVCAGLLAAAAWAIYIVRLGQATRLIDLRYRERLLERENIARDLHDTFFQSVQSLFMRLHTVTKQLPAHAADRHTLERVLDDSDRVMAEGREMFVDLRPANDQREFADLMAEYCADYARAHPVTHRVLVQGQPRPLVSTASTELRKIAREALYNAFRHARATSIEIEVVYEGERFRLRVRDDGSGFDTSRADADVLLRHRGLQNMRTRADGLGATFSLWSRSGSGTEIEVVVPAGTAYPGVTRSRWFGQAGKGA